MLIVLILRLQTVPFIFDPRADEADVADSLNERCAFPFWTIFHARYSVYLLSLFSAPTAVYSLYTELNKKTRSEFRVIWSGNRQ